MDDETCLKLIQQGGQAAQQGIAVLSQRYAPRLTGHLIRHFRCTPEAAEDVVQDAFVNIVQDIRSKATNRREIALQSVCVWIWRITINRATDMVWSAAYRSGRQRQQASWRRITGWNTTEPLRKRQMQNWWIACVGAGGLLLPMNQSAPKPYNWQSWRAGLIKNWPTSWGGRIGLPANICVMSAQAALVYPTLVRG